MKKLKKYFFVLFIIIRNSFYKIVTYRANFFSGLITDFCFNISRVIFINVLLQNVEDLGGWGMNHYLLFFGCSFLAESIYMFFFYNSHTTISRQISNGDMDFLLTKPMSEMFMLSAMNTNIGSGLSNFILGFIFVSKATNTLKIELSISKMAAFIFLVVCGSIIYFSISFIINLLSFWFVKAHNVFDIFMNITDLYRYPGDIFPRIISTIITFVVPLQLISIFPAKFLLDITTARIVFGAIIYSTIFMLLSYSIMRKAIASYTSASS